MGLEVSRDPRGAGDCMACRAVSVPTGGATSPVGAGAVEPNERVTTATVGTVGAPIAVGCGGGKPKSRGWPKPGVGPRAQKGRRRGGASPPRGLRRWDVPGLQWRSRAPATLAARFGRSSGGRVKRRVW